MLAASATMLRRETASRRMSPRHLRASAPLRLRGESKHRAMHNCSTDQLLNSAPDLLQSQLSAGGVDVGAFAFSQRDVHARLFEGGDELLHLHRRGGVQV